MLHLVSQGRGLARETMLHFEVLQLPLYIGWGYGWCGMPGIGVCVCGWENGKRYRDDNP